MTSRPCAAIDTARLADTVVLPTPPLPPVTAMTLTGREELSSARASAWAGGGRGLGMGGRSSEVAGEVGLVTHGRSAFLQREGRAHQPHPPLVRGMQVFGHPLSIADIGDFQAMPQCR